jgi:sulfur carrier protein
MKVIIRNPRRREIEVEGRRQVRDLLRELNLNPESVLVIRDGNMLTRDDTVESGDTIEILSAISGG